jgi:hypothetical protein
VGLLAPVRPTPKDDNKGAGASRTEVGDARLPGFCLAGHATRHARAGAVGWSRRFE